MTTNKSGKWINSSPDSLPSVAVTVLVSDSSYYQTASPRPVLYKKAFVKATPDTAAQITLAGSNLLNRMKISRQNLIQVSQRIKGVSNHNLHIIGALLLDITG